MRVACIGAQNTGKTTFIQEFLKQHPEYSTPTETYRDVIRKHGLKINREGTIANQWLIFESIVKQYEETTQENVIFDRSPLDAFIYTVYIAGSDKDLHDMYEKAVECMKALDCIFWFPVTGNDFPIKKDGLRDTDPEYRIKIDNLFRIYLHDKLYDYRMVHSLVGDTEDKIVKATCILHNKPLFTSPSPNDYF